MKSLLILLLCFPSTVFAKTIFEPSLSANTGGFGGEVGAGSTLTAGQEVDLSYSSFSAGFRYGITRRYIHVTAVAEAHYINLSASSEFETTAFNDAVAAHKKLQTNLGLGIGYEWNIPIRTYLVIGFPFSSVEVSYYFSEKMLVGLKYNRMDMDFAGADLSVNTFGVAVSFPIEFEYPDNWWRKTDWN